MADNAAKRRALTFVMAMGIVNLFADMTYEGARGVVGAFLQHLGASGTLVGVIAGGGEFAGYAIRSVSGAIADRTGAYWVEVWAGYILNMLCVPALALAGNWPAAAGLVVGERVGRGIRRPVVSAIIAQAGRELGGGCAFGLNEMLDQIGATIGPLIVAYAIAHRRGFRFGFGVLIVPALLTLAFLVVATVAGSRLVPQRPDYGEPLLRDSAAFWRYAAGGALVAAGYVDFALISYHFQHAHIVSTAAISVIFAGAMAMGAIAAPILGNLLDRIGNVAVAAALVLTAAATAFAFLGHGVVAEIGGVAWGIGTAAQDALLLAIVAGVISKKRGATSFGIYDLVFGFAWFVGSGISGALLDRSLVSLVVFSVVLQVAAIPFFVFPRRAKARKPQA